jgi:hypothetical protein
LQAINSTTGFQGIDLQKKMKQTLILLAATAQLLSVSAQNKKFIKWKSDTIDLGKIPQSVPDTVVYEFKNTGKTPLLITSVKTPCQCTSAGYTEEIIKPGKSGKVTAVYNAAHPGAFTKTVSVFFNVPEANTYLVLRGEVMGKNF